MEGPRSLRPDEMPSLAKLVDTVFMEGREGAMGAHFPALFDERNARNCLVFADGARVVSHVGMLYRWACIDGCSVRVACIGAVSTYDEYRGQGLATRLFEHARAQAVEDGMDFMMISGDRTLYRRPGAVHVGIDWIVRIDRAQAEAWRLPGIELGPFREEDIPGCQALHAQRSARFVRPLEDWIHLRRGARADARDVRTTLVWCRGTLCGYYVVPTTKDETVTDVVEFAGEPYALAAALGPLMERRGLQSIILRLQRGDVVLRGLFERDGVPLERKRTDGTLLILNFSQLVERLHPIVEARTREDVASRITMTEANGVFRFQAPDAEIATDRPGAARVLFGHPEEAELPGMLGSVLPFPTLWYGINYV